MCIYCVNPLFSYTRKSIFTCFFTCIATAVGESFRCTRKSRELYPSPLRRPWRRVGMQDRFSGGAGEGWLWLAGPPNPVSVAVVSSRAFPREGGRRSPPARDGGWKVRKDRLAAGWGDGVTAPVDVLSMQRLPQGSRHRHGSGLHGIGIGNFRGGRTANFSSTNARKGPAFRPVVASLPGDAMQRSERPGVSSAAFTYRKLPASGASGVLRGADSAWPLVLARLTPFFYPRVIHKAIEFW